MRAYENIQNTQHNSVNMYSAKIKLVLYNTNIETEHIVLYPLINKYVS